MRNSFQKEFLRETFPTTSHQLLTHRDVLLQQAKQDLLKTTFPIFVPTTYK